MKQKPVAEDRAVSIETGAADWQLLQQDANGVASATLAGRWWTLMKRRQPNVLVRVVREGGYSAISRAHDWTEARCAVDRSGMSGTWTLTLKDIPRGGPYRVETSVGSAEDAVEWRRGGDAIHFLGVGDVWLIAGQSNAAGTAQSPVDDPSEIGIHQFAARGWELAAHGYRHHPWLTFAKTLKKELGYPIGLIPTAVGGSPISRWDPGQKGDLFAIMQDRVRAADGAVKGVLWYQGESDVGPKEAPLYKARFTRFAKGVRRLTGQPALPIITVQLNRLLSGDNGPGWEAIRECQRQLSHELKQVFIVSVFESILCDGIHNGSLGNLLIAQRAADAALGGVYGRDMPFRHPECVEARQVADAAIELRFDHVVTRLDYIGRPEKEFPFAVRDGQGEVLVSGFSLPGRNIFRIELKRALAGAATVTGAPGSCPPHVLPRDISGYRSMLGFTMAVARRKEGKGTV